MRIGQAKSDYESLRLPDTQAQNGLAGQPCLFSLRHIAITNSICQIPSIRNPAAAVLLTTAGLFNAIPVRLHWLGFRAEVNAARRWKMSAFHPASVAKRLVCAGSKLVKDRLGGALFGIHEFREFRLRLL